MFNAFAKLVLMPQFDTFSFLSQLFWVFSVFSLFYMALSYYVLPAIAITLKVRKRQLSLSALNSQSNNIVNNTDIIALVGVSFEKLLVKDRSLIDLSSTIHSFDTITINTITFKDFSKNLATKLNSLVLQG
jgi:hypothetical protein